MKTLILFLLVALLVSVMVVTLRNSALPPPAPLQPAIAPVVQLPKKSPTHPSTARSVVDISGPLKDRGWARKVVPPYPSWAEEEGIAGVVSVKIWVTPEGRVKSFTQLVQTSRYPAMDETALEALRQWEFAAIPNATGDQWGVATFRFKMVNVPGAQEVLRTGHPPYVTGSPHPGLLGY